MRIAHISDTHLGHRQYNLDERESDIYEAFEQAVNKAIEERVDVLIHAGDLFDSPNPPIKALYVFKNALKKINEKMKFYCVLGDHDRPKRRGMPPHKLFEIRVLGVNGLEWEDVNGILIAGVSNLRGRMAELLKEEMKKFDALAEKYRKSILVAHQAIDRYLPFEGSYELKEDELPKNATYYAFGHLHARQLVRFGKGFFAYAGSTEILSKDDISSWKKDGKGFYIVDFEGDEPSIQKINLDTRPQIEMEVDQDNLASVFNLDFTKKPILHLKVKGMKINRVNIQKKLDELLKDKVLYHRIDFIDLSKPITELPKGQLRIEELFKKFLKDERLSNLAIELLPLLSKKDIEAAKQVASSYLNEELEK